MFRKFATGMIAASTLVSGIAQALGLGEATVQSALNQPLRAEIELVNVRDLQPSEIIANLAPREEFLRVGVDRVFFLSDLRFKVVYKDNGKAVIQVTSSKPVREPYLDFLVEVTWPNGRLLREYALLIDPPTYSLEVPQPVQPATTSAAATTADSATQPPARSSAPARQATPASAQGTSYGPTRASDTLWDIAMRFRPDSRITPQQMMLAIRDLNPDAFVNGNINRLKAGQVLRIPTAEQALSRTAREAIAEVAAQNRALKAGKPTRSAVDATGRTARQEGTVRPTGEDVLKVVVAEAAEGQQGSESGTAKSGSSKGSALASDEVAKLENQLAVVMERLDTSSRENAELKARLKELEAQVETLSRLAAIKDDQLAALQRQQDVEGQLQPAEGAASTPSGSTEQEASVPVTEAPAETTLAAAGADNAADQMPEATPEAPAAAEETTAEAGAPQMPVEEQPVQQPVTPITPPPVQQAEPSLMERLLTDPMYQIGAGTGLLVILLALWGISRKREQAEEESDVNVLITGEDGGAVASDADEAATELEMPEGGAGEGQDVIAEADVYIAYQRFDQAAQILEKALESEPDRTDIKLKLLEVLGEDRQAERFNSLYAELLNSGNDDVIAQAEAIHERFGDLGEEEPGLSLDDLESQLLSGGEFDTQFKAGQQQEGVADQDSVEGTDDLLADLSLDETEETVEASEAGDVLSLDEEEDNLDIEFDLSDIDLGEDSADTGQAVAEQSESVDFGEDIEFDLDLEPVEGDDRTGMSSAEDAQLTDQVPAGDVSEFDLDLDIGEDLDALNEADTAEQQAAESEAVDAGEAPDLDAELSEEFLEAVSEVEDTPESIEEEEDEALDLSLDEEIPESQDESSELSEAGLDTDLGMQDVSTGPTEEELATDGESAVTDSGSAENEADEALDEFDLDTADLDLDNLEGELEALSGSLDETDALLDELDSGSEEASDIVPDEGGDAENLTESVTAAEAQDDLQEVAEEAAEEPVSAESADLAGETQTPEPMEGEDEVLDEEDFDFLADTDEAATKLDLARAYIDMGDKEGARDILEEVAEEGSPEQREEARSLLKNL